MLIKVIMQIILLGLTVFGISTIMEWYKKNIRKDKAGVWEIRIIAAVLSILAAVGFKVTGLLLPVITAIFAEASPWLNALVYAVVIFVLQVFVDFKVVKAIVKAAGNLLPTGDKILKDEIKRLMANFEGNAKITIAQVCTALSLFGVTEDTVETVLKEIGVDADKIDRIVDAFKKVMEERNPEKVEEK